MYSCLKLLRDLSSNTISPPPSTVSIVLASKLGVSASKSLKKKKKFKIETKLCDELYLSGVLLSTSDLVQIWCGGGVGKNNNSYEKLHHFCPKLTVNFGFFLVCLTETFIIHLMLYYLLNCIS